MQANDLQTVIFLGRPGSGKGTQAKLLAKKTGWSIFSSGDTLKALIGQENALGRKVKEDYMSGQLAPDWLVEYLFLKATIDAGDNGIIYEGFPRRLSQAEHVDTVLSWLERPYKVIDLEVSEEVALKRQLDRAKVEDRPDSDGEEKIKARFAVYREHTEPVAKFFDEKGLLLKIPGEETQEEIFAAISAALHIA